MRIATNNNGLTYQINHQNKGQIIAQGYNLRKWWEVQIFVISLRRNQRQIKFGECSISSISVQSVFPAAI